MCCGFLMTGRGQFTLVDEDVMEELDGTNWKRDSKNHYVKRNVGPIQKRRVEYLHRRIMGAPTGLEVDHKNRIRWDNRRGNLRIATISQNRGNKLRHARSRASQYKGVRMVNHSVKWEARTSSNGKDIRMGIFETEIEAAAAYNDYALKTFGEFSCLNQIK